MALSKLFDSDGKIIGRFSMDTAKMNDEGCSELFYAFDDKKQRNCVAKILADQNGTKSKETEFLRKLKHPYIIEYIWEVDGIGLTILFMELGYCTLKNFVKYDHELVISNFVKYSYQMVQAVAFIHRKHVIHRDIKTSNFVMVGDVVKLIDFGHATYLSGQLASGWLSGPPEILCKMPYNQSLDVWDLGLSFAFMVEGKNIVHGQEEILLFDIFRKFDRLPKEEVPEYDEVYQRMDQLENVEAPEKVKFDGKISNDLVCMIENCLQLNPSKRITSAELAVLSVFDNCNNIVM